MVKDKYNYFLSYKNIFSFFLFLFFLTYVANNYFVIGNFKLFYFFTIILFYIFIVYVFLFNHISVRLIKLLKEDKFFFFFFLITVLTTFINAIIFNYFDNLRFVWFLINLLTILCIYTIIRIIDIKIEQLLKIIFISFTLIFLFDFKESFKILLDGNLYRFTGGFSDPNGECSILLLYIAVTIVLFLKSKKKIIKFVYFFFTFIGVSLLLTTFSRAGIISLSVFFISVLLLNRIKAYKKLFLLLISLVLFIKVISLVPFKNYLTIMSKRFDVSSNLNEYNSAISRVREMKAGLNLLINNPHTIFLGSGFGTTEFEYFKKEFSSDAPITPRIHNTPFALLVEDGIIGIFILTIIFFNILHKLYKQKHDNVSFVVISLIISETVLSMSVWLLYFLPFWLAVFILPKIYLLSINNKNSYD